MGAAPPARAATIQDFDGPGTAYTLTEHQNAPGGAVLPGGPTGNFLRLAFGGSYDTTNTIAFDLTDPGAHPQITSDFDFRMQRYGTGADGIGVVLLNTSLYETQGASPLINEAPLTLGSLGLGFNIFQNPETSDPNNNFLRLYYDAQLVATVAQPGIDLASGQWIHAHFEVAATPGGGEVSLELTPSGGAPVFPFADFLIPSYTPYESRVTFGGRTGGLSADHDIDNVMVSFVPEPSSVSLLLLGLAGLAARRPRRG